MTALSNNFIGRHSHRREERRPLRVLLSVPPPRETTNPYITLLAENLEEHTCVHPIFFSWRHAILGRYDVFHAHWPENLVSGRPPLKNAVRQCLTVLFLLRMAASRIAVVRTVHNIDAHDGVNRRGRWLLRWLNKQTRVRILLNRHTPVPNRSDVVLAPHAHYRDWFASHDRCETVPGRITYFGSIRRYKSIDRLFGAFGETSALTPGLSLTISGKPSSPELEHSVRSAIAEDPRISANLGFVDDAELTAQVTAAELVVLPYRDMHNSGGVFAALSLDRPVLIPRNAVNLDLANEIGTAWVHLFEGELTGADIEWALTRSRQRAHRESPNLSARGWEDSARAHERAYGLATRRSRSPLMERARVTP